MSFLKTSKDICPLTKWRVLIVSPRHMWTPSFRYGVCNNYVVSIWMSFSNLFFFSFSNFVFQTLTERLHLLMLFKRPQMRYKFKHCSMSYSYCVGYTSHFFFCFVFFFFGALAPCAFTATPYVTFSSTVLSLLKKRMCCNFIITCTFHLTCIDITKVALDLWRRRI